MLAASVSVSDSSHSEMIAVNPNLYLPPSKILVNCVFFYLLLQFLNFSFNIFHTFILQQTRILHHMDNTSTDYMQVMKIHICQFVYLLVHFLLPLFCA